jgi:nucleoside diphosphate kinase
MKSDLCLIINLGMHLFLQVWEGNGVVASARKMIGATKPLEAEPGTIRGDLAIQVGRNVVHGSDSPENGERETGGFLYLQQ